MHLFLALAAVLHVATAAPKCSPVTLSVPAAANNLALPSSLNLSSLTTPADWKALEKLPVHAVSGTYDIAAIYCEPEVKNVKRKDTLQVLVHGVTFTKSYWSGDGFDPSIYSYVDYASRQGYPTLAFDRICNGDSSKPNGLLACQLPLNTEILNEIINQVKTSTVVGGRTFPRVLAICHSEGSTICQLNMQVHPDAPVGAYVLSGMSDRLLLGAPGSFLAGHFLPAAIAKPAEYGDLALDPTYMVGTSEHGIEGIFFAGNYNKTLAAQDFANTHSLTLGELATAPLSQLPALKFKGQVLVINGDRDQIFCSNAVTDPLVGFKGDCGSGSSSTTAQTKILMPNAQFQYSQVANTGHCINLHFSGPKAFATIHEYLASLGF